MVENGTLLMCGLISGFVSSFLGVGNIILAAQSSAKRGVHYGFAVALGTLAAQAIWSTIAAMTMFSGAKQTHFDHSFSWVGVLIILFVAYKMFTQSDDELKSEQQQEQQKVDLAAWIPLLVAGFLLSISAPQRVLFYVGVFSGFGVHLTASHLTMMIPLVGGVLAGTACWWVLFLAMMKMVSAKLTTKHYRLMGKSGAVILMLMGLSLAYSLVM